MSYFNLLLLKREWLSCQDVSLFYLCTWWRPEIYVILIAFLTLATFLCYSFLSYKLQGSNVITMSCDEIPTAIWHFTFFVGIINCIIKNSSKDQIHYIFLQDDNFSLPAKQIIDLQHSREYNVIQPWVVMKYLVCNLTCFLVLLNFRWIINHIIKITPKTCQRTTFISPFFRMIYFSLSLLNEL